MNTHEQVIGFLNQALALMDASAPCLGLKKLQPKLEKLRREVEESLLELKDLKIELQNRLGG